MNEGTYRVDIFARISELVKGRSRVELVRGSIRGYHREDLVKTKLVSSQHQSCRRLIAKVSRKGTSIDAGPRAGTVSALCIHSVPVCVMGMSIYGPLS